MVNLENAIKESILNNEFSIGEINVSEPYPYKSLDLSRPTIVVQELVNVPVINRETAIETTSEVTYQISVLSRATTVNIEGEEITKKPYDVVVELSMEVCDLLRRELMLSRVGSFLTRPYTADNTVIERVFRVTGIIDLEHNILYRR